MNNPLGIIETSAQPTQTRPRSRREDYIQETHARCDRYWKQKSTTPSIKERLRFETTWNFVDGVENLAQKHIADLGCGNSPFASRCASRGARVTALDASRLPWKEEASIDFRRECLPYTTLEDRSCDLVICTDVLAELPPSLHRLCLSEIQRLLITDAHAIISTPLDVHTDGALEHFLELLCTEFEVVTLIPAYHRLHQAWEGMLTVPSRFVKASRDPSYRHRLLHGRKSFVRKWVQANTSRVAGVVWKPVAYAFSPLLRLFSSNKKLLNSLESVSKNLWDTGGVTHVTAVVTSKKPF